MILARDLRCAVVTLGSLRSRRTIGGTRPMMDGWYRAQARRRAGREKGEGRMMTVRFRRRETWSRWIRPVTVLFIEN